MCVSSICTRTWLYQDLIIKDVIDRWSERSLNVRGMVITRDIDGGVNLFLFWFRSIHGVNIRVSSRGRRSRDMRSAWNHRVRSSQGRSSSRSGSDDTDLLDKGLQIHVDWVVVWKDNGLEWCRRLDLFIFQMFNISFWGFWILRTQAATADRLPNPVNRPVTHTPNRPLQWDACHWNGSLSWAKI